MSLTELSVLELRRALGRGEVSAEEVTRAFVEQMERMEPLVEAYLIPMADTALARARRLDESKARGDSVGRLHGIPLAVKDNISVQGVTCTCGSRMLEHYTAPYDATAVRHLLEEGAVVLGKTNLDEFSMGSSTEASAFHWTRNPWDLTRVPGGSSGGSAAAVAAREAPAALGTDTGGSIRQPAAFCGVVGLRPTYGRVSRYGLVAHASSLDQIGPLTRSVEDAALLLGVLSGSDAHDSTSWLPPADEDLERLNADVTSLRLGIVSLARSVARDIEVCYRRAITVYEELGAQTVEVKLPPPEESLACYYVLATAEASSNLARYDGVRYGFRADAPADIKDMYRRSRSEGLGGEVKRRILLGTYVLSAGYYDAYYAQAQKVRAWIASQLRQLWHQVEVAVIPTTPTPAFPFGERTDDPLAMYHSDIFTIVPSLAGVPAISLPAGLTPGGLPVGIQLIGRPFDEARLLGVAHAFQLVTDYHKARPPVAAAESM